MDAGSSDSAVIRRLIRSTDHSVINVDKLTYAASEDALEEARRHPRHTLVVADIGDAAAMREVFATHQPDAVMHLAAESHVDRSIDGPSVFIQTNVVGTFVLLQAAREYWAGLPAARKAAFRFHHVSTDEVFGALDHGDPPFTETTAYDPRSPYSASKAASDHLVRAWQHTYGLPTIVSNTSNNYGPWQFPEKLIPLVTLNALEGKPLPVYGDGSNQRDWLFVEDHAEALVEVRRARHARRNLRDRRAPAAQQPRRGARHLRRPRRPVAASGRPARTADQIRHAIGRATISATRSTRPAPKPRSRGARRMISSAASRARSTGIWPTVPGGKRCAPPATPANASAPRAAA